MFKIFKRYFKSIIMCLLIILTVLNIKNHRVVAQSYSYDLPVSKVSVSFDADTGQLNVLGQGVNNSLLNADEFDSMLDTIGRDKILSMNFTDLSFNIEMPCLSAVNCTNINFSNINTSKVQDMKNTFINCQSVTSLDLTLFDVSNVKFFTEMFKNCYELKSVGNLKKWDTGKGTDFTEMFRNCTDIEELILSNWQFQSSADISSMFYGCESLVYLDFGGCVMANVEGNEKIIKDCDNLDRIKMPKSLNTGLFLGLPANFYDDENYNIHTSLSTAPMDSWVYRDAKHAITYSSLDAALYNLPTEFWESQGITVNAIGKILDNSSNPLYYYGWLKATNISNVNVSFRLDDFKNITISRGIRTDIKIVNEQLSYKLLTLKDTLDDTYSKQIYYISALSFANAIQTEELPILTKEGYNFLGWSKSSDDIIPVNKIKNNYIFDADIIYAHWEPKTYFITIKDKTGDSVFECKYGDSVWPVVEKYLENYTAPEGYSLISWNTLENGSGTSIDSSSLCLGDMTIYPVYLSKFAVYIPQKLVADSEGNCDFVISSDISKGKLEIIMPDTVTYHQEGKDDVPANVKYESNIINSSNKETLFKIECNNLSAGTWKCLFNIKVLYISQ